MRLLNLENLVSPLRVTALVAGCAFIMSCTKGGGISGAGSSSSDGATLTITSAYPTSSGNTWTPIVVGSRTYIKGLSLTIEGTCSRGLSMIKVHEGSAADYTQTAQCADDGSFTWTKNDYVATAGEGDKTITITGYDSTGAASSGAVITKDVRIDNTAPAIPVITTPGSSPYIYQGASDQFTIIGTVDVDTVAVTINGTTIIPSAGSFSYVATLIPGQATDFNFAAVDAAGNASGGPPQLNVNWAPAAILNGNLTHADAVFAGVGVTTNLGLNLESTVSHQPGVVTDLNTSFRLETGFNYFTNSVRAQ